MAGQAALCGAEVGRLTSTRSQKNTFPFSEQLTTWVSRSVRQQSSLYSWFLWPVYLGLGRVGSGVLGLTRGGKQAPGLRGLTRPAALPCPCQEAAVWSPGWTPGCTAHTG